jgi:hypothetical protein
MFEFSNKMVHCPLPGCSIWQVPTFFFFMGTALFHNPTQSAYRLCFGLDKWGTGVQFSATARCFPLLHRTQTGSGAHSTSCPIDTIRYFPMGTKLITYVHLMSSFRMRGVIPQLHIHLNEVVLDSGLRLFYDSTCTRVP